MRKVNFQSTEDARAQARNRLPWMVFDYIDGAAGNEHGARRNRRAFERMAFETAILQNVSERSLAVSLGGKQAARPFGISPMGMCNLAAPGADRMLARLAARNNVPLGVSTVASTPMEELITVADGNAWFQLYFSGDGEGTFRLVERARSAGYETLVLTVDVPEVGRRPRELRHGFHMPFKIGPKQFLDFAMHPRWSLSTLAFGRPEMANFQMDGFSFDRTESRARADWGTLSRLRDMWKGKLVVKGVLSVSDAVKLKNAGVDAIQVSSHGSRQLEAARSPVLALGDIRQALGDSFPLYYDSGIRSGEDVLKAIASGADFTFLGRILLFAIAAGGEAGLQRIWEIVSAEADIGLAQLGLASIDRGSLAGRLISEV